jgi:ribosomal protein L15
VTQVWLLQSARLGSAKQPFIVKAKFFSKKAEDKIKAAGDIVVLTA